MEKRMLLNVSVSLHSTLCVMIAVVAAMGCKSAVAPGASDDTGEETAACDDDTCSGGDSNTPVDSESDTVTGRGSGTDSQSIDDEPLVHRERSLSCDGVHSPEEPSAQYLDTEYSQCMQHADCTEGKNGKCVGGVGMAASLLSCVYDNCVTDADCNEGEVCYCTPTTAARCLSLGNCQVDSDCGDSGYCSPSMSWDCGGYRPVDGFHCHTSKDTCRDDRDCSGNDYCNYNEFNDRWECTPTDISCVIG